MKTYSNCPTCGSHLEVSGDVTKSFVPLDSRKVEKLRSELECVESWKDFAEAKLARLTAALEHLIAKYDYPGWSGDFKDEDIGRARRALGEAGK